MSPEQSEDILQKVQAHHHVLTFVPVVIHLFETYMQIVNNILSDSFLCNALYLHYYI